MIDADPDKLVDFSMTMSEHMPCTWSKHMPFAHKRPTIATPASTDRETDWAGGGAAARERGMNRLAERLEQSAI